MFANTLFLHYPLPFTHQAFVALSSRSVVGAPPTSHSKSVASPVESWFLDVGKRSTSQSISHVSPGTIGFGDPHFHSLDAHKFHIPSRSLSVQNRMLPRLLAISCVRRV